MQLSKGTPVEITYSNNALKTVSDLLVQIKESQTAFRDLELILPGLKSFLVPRFGQIYPSTMEQSSSVNKWAKQVQMVQSGLVQLGAQTEDARLKAAHVNPLI